MDIKNNPKWMLFERNFPLINNRFGPLFESQIELAKQLPNYENTYLIENVASLKSYLNLSLKSGSDPLSKPMSKKMRDAILKASFERMKDDEYIKKQFETEFMIALSNWKLKNVKNQNDSIDVNEIIFDIKDVTENYIFTHAPAECKWMENKMAKIMVYSLFRYALRPLLNNKSREECSKYCFFLPNTQLAMLFWSSLYIFIQIETTVKEHIKIVELFKKAWDEDVLKVYVVNGDDFSVHITYTISNSLLTPLKSSKNDKLYVLDWLENDNIFLGKMSKESSNYFIKNRFVPTLERVDKGMSVAPVEFNERFLLLARGMS